MITKYLRALKLIGALLIFLHPSVVFSQPKWISTHMPSEACENLHWRDRPHCLLQLTGLQYQQLKKQWVQWIQTTQRQSSCDQQAAISLFELRERAWMNYARSHCALVTHCEQHCGCGYSSVSTYCHVKLTKQRIDLLSAELNDGPELYGCDVR